MPKICNIGITRLFSTGRFEHTKISVNMEPGEKPGTMLKELQGLIEDLNPQCPVGEYELRDAVERIAAPVKPDDEDDPFGPSIESAQNTIAIYDAWKNKREAAYARLDELGAEPTVEDIDNTPTN